MKLTAKKTDLLLVYLCLTASVIFLIFNYLNHWNELPNGFHNWAQSDRYSVAVKFQENLNFFKPQTHNITSENGRCGVEFPFVQYISARVSNLFGVSNLPFIYKLLNLGMLLLGFAFFVRQWSSSGSFKVLLALLLFMSPVLVYYGFNYLPDTASLGLVCLAIGLIIKHKQDITPNAQAWILVVLAFATLIKTSSGIYLLAVMGSLFVLHILAKKWKHLTVLLIWSVLLIGLIAAYDYFLFHKVNKTFWSPVFMSSSQPVRSSKELMDVLNGIGFWHGQYITYIQTILFTGIGAFACIRAFNRKSINPLQWFALFSILGLFSFTLLMGKQYINHDYYFIASFYPLLFVLGYFLHQWLITQKWHHHWGVRAVLVALVLFSGQHASKQYQHRNGEVFHWKNRSIQNDVIWLRSPAQTLDDIGIPADARVFVGYAAAPNTSLIYMNRAGKVFNHEEMTRDSANMVYWFGRLQPDYFIIPGNKADALEKDQPAIFNRLVLFAKRPNMYIYKPI